jgi:hypothetical protein
MQAQAADPPATPGNSAALLERRVLNNLFRLIFLKRALKRTRSVRLRAFLARNKRVNSYSV